MTMSEEELRAEWAALEPVRQPRRSLLPMFVMAAAGLSASYPTLPDVPRSPRGPHVQPKHPGTSWKSSPLRGSYWRPGPEHLPDPTKLSRQQRRALARKQAKQQEGQG